MINEQEHYKQKDAVLSASKTIVSVHALVMSYEIEFKSKRTLTIVKTINTG